MSTRKWLCLLVIVLAVSVQWGCAGLEVVMLGAQAISTIPERKGGAVVKEDQERIFSTDYEKTWRLAVQSMTELNIPIATPNKSDGLMVTDSITIEQKVFGEKVLYKAFAESVETGRYKLNISLVSLEDGKTKVAVKPFIEKYVQYPHSSSMKPQWKIQESNGVIERAVFKKMEEKVTGAGGTVITAALPNVANAAATAEFATLKGNWKGQVKDVSGSESYPIFVKLNGISQGGNCGSTVYVFKDLKCGGSLTYAGTDSGRHILKENIEYGKCVNGLLIHFKKVDTKCLDGEWFNPAKKKQSEGRLYLEVEAK